jgi:Co/Zn/Cd efflux system component
MIEGFLIVIAELFIIDASARRLSSPVEPIAIDFAIGISIVAASLNGVMSWYLQSQQRRAVLLL